MGNFSVNHYARLDVKPQAVHFTYVLDLAELPTLDLLRDWGLEKASPRAAFAPKIDAQAREWASHLTLTANGQPVQPVFETADFAIADGAGDLPVLRVTTRFRVPAVPGTLAYEDKNYEGRAGWKEIVIRSADGAALAKASQGPNDRSSALTAYPTDPNVAPPQDVRAQIEFAAPPVNAPAVSEKPAPAPAVQPIAQPAAPRAEAPAAFTAQAAPAGSVVRGDLLSRLLHQKELTFGMLFIAIATAFGLGAAHALTPGHGKTIVAAYLVGSRGTLKHAAYLGAMVTFTHTVSVFLLGLATLFLFQYVMPEKITQALGVVSGLSIVAIGGWMLWKRVRSPRVHHRHHAHVHPHTHHHSEGQGRAHGHHHHPHTHSHGPGGHVHSHDVPEKITWGSLTALAIGGGLVPCESALLLLLGAIALGRVGLGLVLLLSFSLGLAAVLMLIGALVIYAKDLLPERDKSKPRHPIVKWMPVASAAVVMAAGIVMTSVSMGWIQPKWMI